MSRYPKAEWVPWRYNSPDGQPTYWKAMNKPVAAVLHVAQGYASTAREWARNGHYGASWHFTVCKDGTVLQHLEFEDGGYHAGIPSTAPAPAWSLWKGHGVNVNHYTIGIEHEGFSGDGFPDAQRVASRDLCRWLAGELHFPYARPHFPPHADIDLINRPNDFGPPWYRAQHYQYMFGIEDTDMADPRVDDILRFLGGAEAVKRWLENGNIGLIDAFTAEQVRQNEAVNAINAHIAQHPVGEHAHKSTTTTVTLGGVVR